jgi:ABC-type dipeptide/oligopeptide/nickel transport system ATPase component
VGLSHERRSSYPHELSGGMGRRVLLALAWALRPRVLIADEPTIGLDPNQKTAMLDQMRDLTRQHGTSLLYISHDLRSMASLVQRMLVMSDGRIVESGMVTDILAYPKQALSRELAESLAYLEGKNA